jgi:hypothetical protein
MKIFGFFPLLVVSYSLRLFGQPNPPTWPSTVKVYDPSTPISTIQADTDAAFNINGTSDFHGITSGYAFLFAPGTYTGLNIKVGFYTSVIGLGNSPTNTIINSVSSPQSTPVFSLSPDNTYWRSAENFSTTPAPNSYVDSVNIGMTWAVSHGCFLRSLIVNGSLYLSQQSQPSQRSPQFVNDPMPGGAFMANCRITATDPTKSAIYSGTQGQSLARNLSLSAPSKPAWNGGLWNQVFVGCQGAPPSHCGNCNDDQIPGMINSTGTNYCTCANCITGAGCQNPANLCQGFPYTNVSLTPRIAEKPFITMRTMTGGNHYMLMVPQNEVSKSGTSNFDTTASNIKPIDFENVYVASPPVGGGAFDVDALNSLINTGVNIILTPGVYNLSQPIVINQDNIVVLGIGFPILHSSAGNPCIVIGNNTEIRVGGVILEAGPTNASTLLQWGPSGVSQNNVNSTGFLYDCFARVGSNFDPKTFQRSNANLLVQINNPNVICDNLWLWRETQPASDIFKNICNTGAVINGENVIAYGLACENTLENLAIWNGNNGQCYSFQGSFPLDPKPMQYRLSNLFFAYQLALPGLVNPFHKAFGIGIYCGASGIVNFNAIYVPLGPNIQLVSASTRLLSGIGSIQTILPGNIGFNAGGGSEVVPFVPGPAYLCHWNNEDFFSRNPPGRE